MEYILHILIFVCVVSIALALAGACITSKRGHTARGGRHDAYSALFSAKLSFLEEASQDHGSCKVFGKIFLVHNRDIHLWNLTD